MRWVEDEVHEPVSLANQNGLLPGLETETVAKFQQKILQFVHQGIL